MCTVCLTNVLPHLSRKVQCTRIIRIYVYTFPVNVVMYCLSHTSKTMMHIYKRVFLYVLVYNVAVLHSMARYMVYCTPVLHRVVPTTPVVIIMSCTPFRVLLLYVLRVYYKLKKNGIRG